MTAKPRLLLVDDDPLIAESLEFALEPEHEVVPDALNSPHPPRPMKASAP